MRLIRMALNGLFLAELLLLGLLCVPCISAKRWIKIFPVGSFWSRSLVLEIMLIVLHCAIGDISCLIFFVLIRRLVNLIVSKASLMISLEEAKEQAEAFKREAKITEESYKNQLESLKKNANDVKSVVEIYMKEYEIQSMQTSAKEKEMKKMSEKLKRLEDELNYSENLVKEDDLLQVGAMTPESPE